MNRKGAAAMTHDELVKALIELDEKETAGKQWFLENGYYFNYSQIVPDSDLYKKEVIEDSDIFDKDQTVVIEKVLRFVDVPQHRNEFAEFAYVVEGFCIHRVDGNVYEHSAGDFIVIPPGSSNALSVPENSLCMTLKVRRETFVSLRIPNMALFVIPMVFPCKKDPFILHTVLTLYEQQKTRMEYWGEIINRLFSALIPYLIQNYYNDIRPLNGSSITDFKTVLMLNYIFENYRDVTLRKLAEVFHYNESYLSSLFRKGTGKTFSEGLRDYRLLRAEEILSTNPKAKLSTVCEAIGYHDTVQFIRDFKARYGTTPARYKREKAQKNSSE